MFNHLKKDAGFTLLELIVTVGIAGIVMAMAVPSFTDMMRKNRLTTYSNEFVTALNLARSEAIKRGQQVVVRRTGTSWQNGWQVFVDVDRPSGNTAKENVFNDDGDTILCETTEDCLLRTYTGFPSPYMMVGNGYTDYIRYQPDGSGNNAVGGNFVICASATPNPYTFKLIIINSTGRIQMGRDTNGDGKPEKNDGSQITSCS